MCRGAIDWVAAVTDTDTWTVIIMAKFALNNLQDLLTIMIMLFLWSRWFRGRVVVAWR